MQPDIIREIAEAIIRDQLFLNWRFYALLCGSSFVVTSIGYLLSSYLKKRGETLATKSDMEEILRQVSETTRVTEEVRSNFSQADWAAREWRTARRLKLEELLSSAYSLDKWLDLQRSKWLHDKEVATDESPMDRVKLLSILYFPELQAEAAAVWNSHHEAFIYILEIGSRTLNARNSNDLLAHKRHLDEFSQGWKPLYEAARRTISALERKSSEVMLEVAGSQISK